jgi:hypothetical protein
MHAQALRFLGASLLAAVAAAVLGCASTRGAGGAGQGGASTKTAALPGTPGCFWLRNFDGAWTVLNDSELIVHAPSFSEPYLIRLFEPVTTLGFDERLGFQDVEHTGMICDGAMDNLVVPKWQPHLVPIVAVRKLTVAQERQLLIDNHLKPPTSKPGATHSPR